MEVGVFKCKNCGASLDINKAVNGVIECEYCNSIFTVPKKEASPAALSFLRQGEHELDTCKFEEAYSAFAKAAEYDDKEPEAYFGMALSEFKVQYIKDAVNNRLQPICHGFTDKVFVNNKNYKNAIKYSTEKQKAEYQKKAKEIDEIRSEFLKFKQSGLNYDCFICVKVTKENGEHTEDSHIAARLYKELKNAGYVPFYSEEDIRDRVGADYEAMILYALYCSKCMIVVCCNEDYLQTPWVKNEYTRFLALLKDGDKQSESIAIVFKGTPVEKLSGKSGKIEGINYGEGDALLRILNFAEKFKIAAVPEIQRKEYGKVAYTKKHVTRQGVIKRQLMAVSGGEITVSERAQMNVASEFLARKDFANAVRQCDIILSKNPANSEIHWMRFLASHSCVNEDAYISDYNGASDFTHLEKAIASSKNDKQIKHIYDVLINRIVTRKDIIAYKEYIILPESTESSISDLTDIMYEHSMLTIDANIFREIIKTVTNADKYIAMNLSFAEKVTVQNAIQYYKNILSADEGHGEALYKIFASQHGYSDGSVFDYCCKSENFKDIENKLYAYGYNEYATRSLFNACLSCISRCPEDSSHLFDFILAMIPKDRNEIFTCFLQEYVQKLFDCGEQKYIKKYNELLLTVDKLNHNAYFNRVMLKNGFSNPLELVKVSDILMNDPDYFSAVNSYTERNPEKKNLYLDINYALKELKQILNTPRRLEQALQKISVTKEGLLECKDEVLAVADVADHTSVEFNAKQYRRTLLFNIPAIILIILAPIVLVKPEIVFKYIHYGWIIAILIVCFFALIVVGGLIYDKSRKERNTYICAHIKLRGAIMALCAVPFAVILGCGLGLAHRRTYSLSTAEDFKLFENLPSAKYSAFIVENDIDFNGEAYGMCRLIDFYGKIDGQGHILSNIYYDYEKKDKDMGTYMFGLVGFNKGVVKNITIKNSEFHFKYNSVKGIVAFRAEKGGIIDNCFVENSFVIRGDTRYEAKVSGN